MGVWLGGLEHGCVARGIGCVAKEMVMRAVWFKV